MNNYFEDAFKSLNFLTEEAFPLDDVGMEEMDKFMKEDDGVETIDVIDAEADTQDDLQKDYVGKIILNCSVCHSNVFDDKEEIEVEENDDLANVGKECPYCASRDGFKIVGKVIKFTADDLRDGDEEETEEEEEEKVETEEEIPEEEADVEVEGEVEEKVTESLDIGDDEEDIDVDVEEALTKHGKEARDDIRKKLRKGIDDYNATSGEHMYEKCSKKRSGKRLEEDEGEDGHDCFVITYVNRNRGASNYAKDTFYGDRDALKEHIKELKEKNSGDESFYIISVVQKMPKEFYESLKCRSGKELVKECDAYKKDIKESSELDDIDADADDRKEYAKAKYDRIEDDADSDRDYRLEHPNYKGRLPHRKRKVESITDASITTDDGVTMSMNTEDDGTVVAKVTPKNGDDEKVEDEFVDVDVETNETDVDGGEEEVADLTDTDKEEILDNTQEEETEEATQEETEETVEETAEEGAETEEVDVTDVKEESFDYVCGRYLKESYSNVRGFKTTCARERDGKLIIEGVISFASGAKKNTSFIFEANRITKTGKLKFLGENVEITPNQKAFTLTARANGKTLMAESLSYRYIQEGKRVCGIAKVLK